MSNLDPPHHGAGRNSTRCGQHACLAQLFSNWAKAWAQAAPWKPEKGAKINLMRWRRFVPAEDEAFTKMITAFKTATGVDVVCDERILRGHPAESVGDREYRPGPRHGVGTLFAAAPVPRKVHGPDRRRQLSRQEIRRLGTGCGSVWQVGQQVDRHPGRNHRRPDELPHLVDGKGGLQGIPEGLPGRSSNSAKRSRRTIRRPALRSVTPRATPTPGCTGRCGHMAATSSTRATRSSSTRRKP